MVEQVGRNTEGHFEADGKGLGMEQSEYPVISRRAILAAALMAVGCDKIDRAINGPGTPTAPTPPTHQEKKSEEIPKPQVYEEKEEPVDPNRPEFLDEGRMALSGLALLMYNNDQLDQYIYNAIAKDTDFGHRMYIQKGYKLNLRNGRTMEMPYHAFIFRRFDKRANFELPARLGKRGEGWSVGDLLRSVTKYKADNPKDLEAMRVIIVTSFEMSFGITLEKQYIDIDANSDGSIKSIRYTGPGANELVTETEIATKTEQDRENPERKNIVGTKMEAWALIDRKTGELYMPPSIMADEGIAIPPSAVKEYENVEYVKEFMSQGKRIGIKLNIAIDSIMEEQEKMYMQDRPIIFNKKPGYKTYNFGRFVIDNDPLIKSLAILITEQFETKREKMQAILDFVHQYDYVPDAFGETPRTPRVSLICNGGDCEDSTILAVALARAVGIECAFAYFEGHAAPICDVGGPGTAIADWGGKSYEWAETTGGEHGFNVRTTTRVRDQYGRHIKNIVKNESRGWRVGEKSDKQGPIQYLSRVESENLTKVRQR